MSEDDEPADLEQLLASFKRGISEVVRTEDIETHLDLGLAYAAMGLLPDAAAELELVLRHDPTHAVARATLVAVHARMGKRAGRGPDRCGVS